MADDPRRRAGRHRGDAGRVRRADRELGRAGRHRFPEGLLHGPGDHRAHAVPRPPQGAGVPVPRRRGASSRRRAALQRGLRRAALRHGRQRRARARAAAATCSRSLQIAAAERGDVRLGAPDGTGARARCRCRTRSPRPSRRADASAERDAAWSSHASHLYVYYRVAGGLGSRARDDRRAAGGGRGANRRRRSPARALRRSVDVDGSLRARRATQAFARTLAELCVADAARGRARRPAARSSASPRYRTPGGPLAAIRR